jgi:SpoIIAA-like
METLLQKDYAVINYNLDKDLITLHFVSDVSLENYKTLLNQLLEKITEKKSTKLLIDQRYAEKISMEQKAWLISQWFPVLQKNVGSHFRIGVVSASGMFARLSSEYLVNTLKSKSDLEVQIFNSIQDALKWINEN